MPCPHMQKLAIYDSGLSSRGVHPRARTHARAQCVRIKISIQCTLAIKNEHYLICLEEQSEARLIDLSLNNCGSLIPRNKVN